MKKIQLSRGKFALVDDCAFNKLAKHRWLCSFYGYAVREASRAGGVKRRMIWMHREVLGTPVGLRTDHVNGNTLDNRKANLRVATDAENGRNSKIHRNNKTGLKGVSFHKQSGLYRATINFNRKQTSLGYFENPQAAHAAYSAASVKFHGEFARV